MSHYSGVLFEKMIHAKVTIMVFLVAKKLNYASNHTIMSNLTLAFLSPSRLFESIELYFLLWNQSKHSINLIPSKYLSQFNQAPNFEPSPLFSICTLFIVAIIRSLSSFDGWRFSRNAGRVPTFSSLLRALARVTRGKISNRDNARSVSETAVHSSGLLQALGHRKHRL